MKFFLAFSALIAIASAQWTPKTKEEFLVISDECLKENNVPAALAEQIKKYEYPNEPAVRCQVRCVAIKGGNWDDQNGYNVDHIIQQLATADYVGNRADILKCIDNNQAQSDTCTWAYREFKCMLDNKYIPSPTIA